MEENKYYTPDITEFRVGFEFEVFEHDGSPGTLADWQEHYIKHPNDNGWIWTWENINKRIKDEEIRVKYLDKSDIESCGFKKIGIEQNCDRFFTGRYYLPNTDYKLFFDVLHGKRVYICINEKWGDYPSGKVVFAGNINNISELKILLKQLGIQ